MSDPVCRDCGRTVDLSHIPATCMPRADRIQCSRCWVAWLKQQAVYQQRKYAEAREQRVTAKVHTVRVKVTYTKTGVTRWEDRPLVPWTVSRTRDYKRRHEGVETAMLQARRDAAAVAAVLGEPDE